ncbi:MAG: transporter [Verrucomicrobia bacterium]|nr:transporter [Verrucomicrobiota bacterium]
MKCARLVLVLTITAVISVGSAFAYDLPALNLGFTSFLDGGPPAGPGVYVTEYVQYYSTDEFRDLALGGAEPELDVWVSLSQLIYQAEEEVLGARWGLDVIIPYVGFDLDSDGTPLSANEYGFGDILVGPFLQWDPVMGENGPVFMHRVEFQMIFPTGDYDNEKTLNAGANYFSFNPYWSGTWFITPKWTTTARIHYLWNGKNDDPGAIAPGVVPNDTQAGQAVHANFAVAYAVTPMIHAGINGYYLKQIDEFEVDGKNVDDTEEEVFAIGPGAVVHFSQNSHLFLNAYFESGVENRTEGTRVNLRYVHHF